MKNIILRLENVVYDTATPLYEGTKDSLKRLGYGPISLDDFFNKKYCILQCDDLTAQLEMDKYIESKHEEAFCKYLSDYLLDNLITIKFDMDIYTIFNDLAKDHRIYIVSFLPKRMTDVIISKLHLTKLISTIYCREATENPFIRLREKHTLDYCYTRIIEHQYNETCYAAESGISTLIVKKFDNLRSRLWPK